MFKDVNDTFIKYNAYFATKKLNLKKSLFPINSHTFLYWRITLHFPEIESKFQTDYSVMIIAVFNYDITWLPSTYCLISMSAEQDIVLGGVAQSLMDLLAANDAYIRKKISRINI